MRTRAEVGVDILLFHADEQLAVTVGDKDAEDKAAAKLDELYAEYVAIPAQRHG